MSEFTPGQWGVDEDEDSVFAVAEKDGERVYIVPIIEGINEEEYKANARLIAAAPELYKTLAVIVNELKAYGDDVRDDLYSLMTEAEGILARVDGEECKK